MLPATLGSWKLLQEGVIDDDTRNVLKADDLLNRFYASGNHGSESVCGRVPLAAQRKDSAFA